MKILHWFGFAIILGSTGCKDIGEIPPISEKMEPVTPSKIVKSRPNRIYPIKRTITDNQGRSIDATVLGKQHLKIAFSKNSNHSKFIVSLDRLSSADQEFFRNLADGGNFSEVENLLAQEARLSGRIARWHMDVESAQREAEKLKIPMLLGIMITANPESESLEKKLLYSKELKNWANTNLVLCMLRVDDPSTNRTTSFSAVENRESAAKFGVASYTEPVVMLLKPGGGVAAHLNHAELSDGASAIRSISSVLSGESASSWTNVVAVEAPKKERAKVNGGAVIGGGGGSSSS